MTGLPPTDSPSAAADDRLHSHLAAAAELVTGRHYRQAEVELLRALSSTPSDVRALNLLALVRFKLGKLEEALSTYREVSALRPGDGAVRRNLGLLSLKLQRYEDAVSELGQATRLVPADLRAWSYYGYALAKRGENAAAALAFRRAGQDLLAAQLEPGESTAAPGALVTVPADVGNSSALAMLEAVGSMPLAAAAAAASADAAAPGAAVSLESTEPLSLPVRSPPAEPAPIAAAPAADGELSPETAPLSLVSFVLAGLGGTQAIPAQPPWARLVLHDEAYVRGDAALACAGAASWRPAFRRVRGRTSDAPLGGKRRGFFRLSGAGDVWVAGAPGRWRTLALDDDILYLREDRVLAFDHSVSWEAGRIPADGMRLLQFRGRGRVAVEFQSPPTAVRVTEERPLYVPRARLLGWVGRVVVHGRRGGDPLFQVTCEGEGAILLDVPRSGRHHLAAAAAPR